MTEVKYHPGNPSPSVIIGNQAKGWHVRGALAELVDNSFGAARGNAQNVWILHNRSKRTLTVLDDGRGMNAAYELLIAGAGAGRSVGDIGFYAQGGSNAVEWLSQRATIYTMRDGKASKASRNFEAQAKKKEWDRIPDEWKDATADNTPEDLFPIGHGTMVDMRLLSARTKFHDVAVIAELSAIYAPGLRSGRSITWRSIRDGKPIREVSLTPPADDVKPQMEVSFSEEIDVLGKSLSVSGQITLSDITISKSRVSIGFIHREVESTKDCFVDQETGRSHYAVGVSGWVDLGEGWQDYLTTTKDNFKDDDVRKALYAFIFHKAKPILDKAEESGSRILLDDTEISMLAALESARTISVERCLEDDTDGAVVTVDSEDGDVDVDENDSDGGDAEPQPSVNENKNLGSDDCDNEVDAPAITSVEIRLETDMALEGALCAAMTQDNSSVIAFLNKEHRFIENNYLDAKSRNMPAIAAILLRELAAAISDSEELIKRAFHKPATRKAILGFEGSQRERYISRLLLDAHQRQLS